MARQKSGRTVLITGGTGSVGESLVERFVREAYEVTFTFNRSASRARRIAKKWGAKALQADLSQPFTLEDGKVDVLVNNAAINESSKMAGELSADDWNRTIAVNLSAPFVLTKQCLPYMMKRRWGRIVNISSIYALRAVEGNLPYTVSKHGLSGFVKTVAREYGSYGITCNEICPGPIRSRLLRRICMERAAEGGVDVRQYMREIEEELPIGRLVRPEEVAKMAVVLSSDDCSGVNGASVVVDGGMIV